MRRALALAAALALLGAIALWARSPDADEGPMAPSGAPNVLIIVWDTVRADRLSLYGHDRATTPRLERFAAAGVVFDRAVSPAVWTPPSHASMFTGFAPRHHGVKATYKWLDHHHTTLAEHLGAHGWDTFAFSANPYVSPTTQITQGFDTVANSFTSPWRAAARNATAAKLIPRDRSTDVSPAWVGPRTIGDVHPFKDAGPVAHQALASWLDARVDGQPWFAFVNMMEAHIPRVPSLANRQALLSPGLIELGLSTRASQDELLAFTFGKQQFAPQELLAMQGVYDAALRDLDDATFDLLDELQARGDLDHTLVILLADHGENLGDHHMFGHKYDVWDTLLHVPLVLWWPGHLTPTRVDTPVSTLSLFATVLDAVDLPAPEPGPDLTTSLLDAASPAPLFSELVEATPAAIRRVDRMYGVDDVARWMRTFLAVEAADYKLVRGSDDSERLFHLPTDPGELTDVASDHPDRVRSLGEQLDAFEATTPTWDPDRREHEASRPTVDRRTRNMLEQLGYLDDEAEPEAP